MRILLATDGSEHASEAARQLGELLPYMDNVTLRILTVVDYTADAASEPFTSSDEFLEKVKDSMYKRSLEILSAAEEIIKTNAEIRIERSTLVGSAKKLILQEARDWDAGLIVVGSHGYGMFVRTLLGSVSDAVVHHAPCSVLVARKKQAGNAKEEEE